MNVVRRIYDATPLDLYSRRSVRGLLVQGQLVQDYFAPTERYYRVWSNAANWVAYRNVRREIAAWLEDNDGSLSGFIVSRHTWQRVAAYVQNVASHYDLTVCASCREIGEDSDDYDRCDNCTVQCDDCGATCEETNDDGQCYDCRDRRGSDTTHGLSLDDYSNKSIANIKYNGKDDASLRYFGVELEMEYNGGNALDPRDVLPIQAVLKEDSSLDGKKGAEWVSAPCSEAYWREKMEGMKAGLNRLKSNGWSSWETNRCGLHIHVSKPSTFVTAKFLTLVYSNPAIILSLSGRSTDELEQWASLNDVALDRLIKKATGSDGDASKYAAINMRPSQTIELRFFRGSMLPKRLCMALEFVWSALAWVETEAGLQDASSFPMFSRFVQRNAKAYPHFLEWLQKHGHAPVPKARKVAA